MSGGPEGVAPQIEDAVVEVGIRLKLGHHHFGRDDPGAFVEEKVVHDPFHHGPGIRGAGGLTGAVLALLLGIGTGAAAAPTSIVAARTRLVTSLKSKTKRLGLSNRKLV